MAGQTPAAHSEPVASAVRGQAVQVVRSCRVQADLAEAGRAEVRGGVDVEAEVGADAGRKQVSKVSPRYGVRSE